jgi:predicted metalloendopeptidase
VPTRDVCGVLALRVGGGRPPYRERKEAECGVALPLDFKVEPDDGDPDHYALIVAQAGLGMSDRDYYLGDAAAMRTARNLDAFYPAFGVEPADRLYLKPAERVRIW